MGKGGAGQVGVDDPGLHAGATIDWIDRKDPVQSRRPNKDTALCGQCPSGKAGTRTTGHHRNPSGVQELHHSGDLLLASREDDGARRNPVLREPIGLIDDQPRWVLNDASRPDHPL
jgi:hypothetical protein